MPFDIWFFGLGLITLIAVAYILWRREVRPITAFITLAITTLLLALMMWLFYTSNSFESTSRSPGDNSLRTQVIEDRHKNSATYFLE